MSWNLWVHPPSALPSASDEICPPDEFGDGGEDGAVSLLPVVSALEDDGTGCWHVRPLPDTAARTPLPAHLRSELQRTRLVDALDLRGIGVPDHLVPRGGGIYRLLDLLERLPRPRVPVLRPGDDVAVITVEPPDPGSRSSNAEATHLASEVLDCLRRWNGSAESVGVHVFPWPDDADHGGAGAAESELVGRLRSLRARLELLVVRPDCPGTTAYPACRALPGAQLYLTDVLTSERPAAPLSWGSPIAFIDGRPAGPALLAAVFADRLAGGVT